MSAKSIRLSSIQASDHSTALQMAMNSSYDTIILDFQDEPWVFGPMRFEKLVNKTIVLEEGVLIMAKPMSFPKPTDALLKFVDCRNIKILGKGNELVMNKEEYTDGEWRHLIRLMGCKDFLIDNLILRGSGGDGINIDASARLNYSEAVVINRIRSDNNKRQGISIISAKNIQITNSQFINTKGTLPGAGADLEPNKPEHVLIDILFENCEFRNNYNAGIKLGITRLTDISEPVSITFKDCVLSENFAVENTKVPAEIIINSHKTSPVKGIVRFNNCLIQKSKWGLLYSRKNADGFKVEFSDVRAENICNKASQIPIYLEVPHYRKPSKSGGFHFNNVSIDYHGTSPLFVIRGSRTGSMEGLIELTGNITTSDKDLPPFRYINYSPDKNINVTVKVSQDN